MKKQLEFCYSLNSVKLLFLYQNYVLEILELKSIIYNAEVLMDILI